MNFNNHLSAALIAVAIIVSVYLLGSAYNYKYQDADTISVTGLAEVNFTSDLIVWEGAFSQRSMNMREAYSKLKNDEAVVRQYLKSRNIPDSSIVFSSVDITKDYKTYYDKNGNETSQDFLGYILNQSFTIESRDINNIEKTSREVTDLIDKGIELNSSAPSYYYTNLSSLKMDLLSKASADARQRAETMAESAGSGLGDLKKSNMGIIQITGKFSDEDYSYGGSFNTSDKFKTASVTVKAEYKID